MDEKRVMFAVFGLVFLIAVIGLFLFFKSTSTGEISVRMPVNTKQVKTTKPVSVRRLPIESRDPEDNSAPIILKTKSSYIGNSCLWADNGMLFHISSGAAKHLDFSSDQVGKFDYFSKSDLELTIKPDFYDLNNIYVKGGTIETYDSGARVCIKSYKGQKIFPQAGLSCIENRWWLIANICPLGMPEAPPMPD